MKQLKTKQHLTTSWFGSLLLVFIFSTNVIASDPLIRIGQAWCQCAFIPTEVCTIENRVVFVDKELHQIYTFTNDGVFNGNLAKNGDCVGPQNFSPYRLAYIDRLTFATCHFDNSIKSLTNGKVTSKITTKELGFPDAKPTAINAGDYYIYVALDNNKLIAMYYDYEVENIVDSNCISMDFLDDYLIVLTENSILKTFDIDLNYIGEKDLSGHYTGNISNPTDMVIDNDGTIWITHSEGVTLFYKDGSFGVWGNRYSDMDVEHNIINGDPIVGSKGIFSGSSIDTSEEYFYLTQKRKYGLVASKDLINNVPNSNVHFLAINLTHSKYWKHAKYIWKLQQLLYPQVLIGVLKNSRIPGVYNTKSGLILDGELITNDFTELENPELLSKEILGCLTETSTTEITVIDNKISVDLSGLSNPFETSLITLEVLGGKTPLIADQFEIHKPNRDKLIETNFSLPEYPSILMALLLDPTGKCVGARIIRNDN